MRMALKLENSRSDRKLAEFVDCTTTSLKILSSEEFLCLVDTFQRKECTGRGHYAKLHNLGEDSYVHASISFKETGRSSLEPPIDVGFVRMSRFSHFYEAISTRR